MRGLPNCCSFPPLSPGHRPRLPSLALGDTLSMASQEAHSSFLLLSDPEGKCPDLLLLKGPGCPVLDVLPSFPQLLALPWRSCSWPGLACRI